MATHLRTLEPRVVGIAATVAALPSFPSLVAVTRVHVCAAAVAHVCPKSTGVATMGSEHFSADVGEVVGMTVCHLDVLNVVELGTNYLEAFVQRGDPDVLARQATA